MEANLIPEIEKLIAKYQEKRQLWDALADRDSVRLTDADMYRHKSGVLIQVIDDLKHLAAIE